VDFPHIYILGFEDLPLPAILGAAPMAEGKPPGIKKDIKEKRVRI
jgi:hypothetical protein